jgi:hypothetical protein
LSEGAGVESENEVKAGVGVDDGRKMELIIGVEVNVRVEKYFVTGLRTEICTGAGVCASWGV